MKNKPIVLFLIDSLVVGGAEKSLLNILPLFQEFTPIVCTVYREGELAVDIRKSGIKVVNLNIQKKYGYSLASKKLLLLLNELRPLIIHSSLKNADFIARKAIKKYPIPIVNSIVSDSYSPHRIKHMSFFMRLKVRIVQFYDLLTARQVDCFFSNSESISISTQKDLLIPKEKIVVIHRGRTPFNTEKKIDKKFQFNGSIIDLNGKKVILNVSRLIDTKGHVDLIKAISILVTDYPEIVLLIAGEGPFREKIEITIKKYQLENHVFLLGNRNDVPELFSYSDLFIFSSYYEGLPGALIEAMYSNTPIIATNIDMNLECITEELAELYPVGNVSVLAQKVIYVFQNYQQAKDKASLALSIAFKKFDLIEVAKRHETEYRKILEHRKKI